jgi:hypothetical protein
VSCRVALEKQEPEAFFLDDPASRRAKLSENADGLAGFFGEHIANPRPSDQGDLCMHAAILQGLSVISDP